MIKRVFFLLLVFLMGMAALSVSLCGEVFSLTEVQKPETITVDRNEIILTEYPHVYIYSLKNCKLVKKFGKSGDGPREFAMYVRVQKHEDSPENIVIGSHMKMSFYTRKGDFVKEVRTKSNTTANVYKPLGKTKYAAYAFRQEDRKQLVTVNLFDADLKKIKEVSNWPSEMQPGKFINAVDSDLFGGEFSIYDGKIFVLIRKQGILKGFDDEGKELFSTSHDFDKVEVTQEDKKQFEHFYSTDRMYKPFYENNRSRFKYPKYYPLVRGMTTADGKIFLLTYKKEKGKHEFAVFDLKGKFLKTIMLPFENATARDPYPFAIKDGKLYQLIDNEDSEEWELHIHEIKL